MTTTLEQETLPKDGEQLQEPHTILDSDTEILALKEEIKRLENALLLSAADKDNMRKGCDKQIQEIRDYAISKIAAEIITIMDTIDMALQHAPQDTTDAVRNLVVGIEMIKVNLERVFKQNDIEAVGSQIGEMFDPNLHSATAQEENSKLANNTIAKVMQCGYKLKARLLRPAMVAVVRNKA